MAPSSQRDPEWQETGRKPLRLVGEFAILAGRNYWIRSDLLREKRLPKLDVVGSNPIARS